MHSQPTSPRFLFFSGKNIPKTFPRQKSQCLEVNQGKLMEISEYKQDQSVNINGIYEMCHILKKYEYMLYTYKYVQYKNVCVINVDIGYPSPVLRRESSPFKQVKEKDHKYPEIDLRPSLQNKNGNRSQPMTRLSFWYQGHRC